jgi:integrase
MGSLTAMAVKGATKPGRYQDGDGLMLIVKESGARSWQVRLQVDGKRRDFGLGSAKTVSLSEAREKAAELRKLFRGGVDPVAQKKAAKMARLTIPTFKEAAEAAHADLVAGWRNGKHRRDWLSSVKAYAFPTLGEIRIDHVEAPMVRDLLLPIWLEKPETARRVRQRVRAIIDWAVAKGFRQSLDLSGIGKGLPKQRRANNHFAAMPYDELPAFVAKLNEAPDSMGRLALLFTIFTAARSGETRGATWQEIDLEKQIWSIPGNRMKAGRDHSVPLNDGAIAILEKVKLFRLDKYSLLFPGKGGKALSDMTMSKILRDMELPFTVHGMRSSFKDWAVECTSFPDAVSEAALAHADTNRTRASYRRTDFFKMRCDLMAAWDRQISGAHDNVVPLVSNLARFAG